MNAVADVVGPPAAAALAALALHDERRGGRRGPTAVDRGVDGAAGAADAGHAADARVVAGAGRAAFAADRADVDRARSSRGQAADVRPDGDVDRSRRAALAPVAAAVVEAVARGVGPLLAGRTQGLNGQGRVQAEVAID